MKFNLLDRSSLPIQDSEIAEFVDQKIKTYNFVTVTQLEYQQYDTVFRSWLSTKTENKIIGLDQFSYSCYSSGSAPTFGEFISRNPGRRIRSSRSDFILTAILAREYKRNFCYLEDDSLDQNDCVIISLPFSGNGSTYPDFNSLLDQCDQMDIPVMLDAAYYGISYGLEYNLTHPCVQEIVFSLSKNFYCNDLRVGIRFSRDRIDDGVSASLIMAGIFNKLGAQLGIDLLSNFSHAWFINKYKQKYFNLCSELELVPTNTITLGIGDNIKYSEFIRGDYVRVNISRAISQ